MSRPRALEKVLRAKEKIVHSKVVPVVPNIKTLHGQSRRRACASVSSPAFFLDQLGGPAIFEPESVNVISVSASEPSDIASFRRGGCNRSPPRNCAHEALPFVEAPAKAKLAGRIETQPGNHLAAFSAFRIGDVPIMTARDKDVRRERVMFGFHCRKLGLNITYRRSESLQCVLKVGRTHDVQPNISAAERQAGAQSRLSLRLKLRCSGANRRFQFHKRRQLFIRAHNEPLPVAARHVHDPERSPVAVYRRDTAPAPSGFSDCLRLSFQKGFQDEVAGMPISAKQKTSEAEPFLIGSSHCWSGESPREPN
jgi:hypothetical protein